MSFRNVVLFACLIAAATGSWLLARPDSPAETDTRLSAPQRGYYLKAARILGTDVDGSLLYEIRAESAEQLITDLIEFSNVRVAYSPQSAIPWVVTADSATVREDQQRILLRGHVMAVSAGEDEDTEIRTQYLELRPEEFIAETDQRVQIRIGARSLTATGMLASLQDNRLELKSNVSGKFSP